MVLFSANIFKFNQFILSGGPQSTKKVSILQMSIYKNLELSLKQIVDLATTGILNQGLSILPI